MSPSGICLFSQVVVPLQCSFQEASKMVGSLASTQRTLPPGTSEIETLALGESPLHFLENPESVRYATLCLCAGGLAAVNVACNASLVVCVSVGGMYGHG